MSGKPAKRVDTSKRIAEYAKAGTRRRHKVEPPKPKHRKYSAIYTTESASGDEVKVESFFPTKQEAIDYAKSLVRNSKTEAIFVYGIGGSEGDKMLCQFAPSKTDPTLKPYPKYYYGRPTPKPVVLAVANRV